MGPEVGCVTTADGRSLTTYVWGSGPDLVVLEAGLGFGGRYWGPVARLVAARARVVAYDRSGFGQSTPDRQPRTLDRLARDLIGVVHAHPGERVVLCGHSWGGPIVRRTASLLDPVLAGIVLVDQADEGADLYFTRAAAVSDRLTEALLPALARTGLLRLSMAAMTRRHLPADDRAALLATSSSVQAAHTAVAENQQVRPGLGELRADPPVLPVPVTVLSGMQYARVTPGRGDLIRAHQQTAAHSTQGRFVPARASQHLVPLTEPGLIADEVIRLLPRR